jgi:hypothetical protein
MSGYSVYKCIPETNYNECLYDFIDDIKEADLLAQLAMSYKKDYELIIIMPGSNRGIKNKTEEYKKALELTEKYKAVVECQRCKKKIRSYKSRELQLDGMDDVYTLELCKECWEYLSTDYYSPEQVDELVKGGY